MNEHCEMSETKLATDGQLSRFKAWRSNRFIKGISLYFSMVVVSTVTIFFLEHVPLLHSLRTAFVAAIGKSVAASWVVQIFD